MIPVVAIMFGIGIAAAAGEDGGEIESLTVLEGENLTISSYIEKWDEDPQVFVFRLKPDSSLEAIAQFFCHKKACTQRCWRSGVSLTSDGGSVNLILTHVNYNQTGLYEVRNHSNKRRENKIYNVTVCQPPLITIIPEKTASAPYSGFTAEIKAVTVSAVLTVLAFGIIGAIIYWKHRKTNFDEVSQDDGN